MRVIFVFGPPYAGKSTFIKNNYPNAKVIDVYDYQPLFMTKEVAIEAYKQSLDDLKDAILTCPFEKMDGIIVYENTGFKKNRRKEMLDFVRQYTDCPVDLLWFKPTKSFIDKTYKRNEDGVDWKIMKEYKKHIEIPTSKENFDSISFITPIFSDSNYMVRNRKNYREKGTKFKYK